LSLFRVIVQNGHRNGGLPTYLRGLRTITRKRDKNRASGDRPTLQLQHFPAPVLRPRRQCRLIPRRACRVLRLQLHRYAGETARTVCRSGDSRQVSQALRADDNATDFPYRHEFPSPCLYPFRYPSRSLPFPS
jgi:hypothetical protein